MRVNTRVLTSEEALVEEIVSRGARIEEIKRQINLWKMKRRHAHLPEERHRLDNVVESLKEELADEQRQLEAARTRFIKGSAEPSAILAQEMSTA